MGVEQLNMFDNLTSTLDSFGELAIKSGGMRSASIQTNISTEFLLIDNEEFDHGTRKSV